MARNSLFAILLRSPWWISLALAGALLLPALALLPEHLRVAGALSALPFVVIAGLAACRQWRLPSAARVAQTRQAVAALSWPAFAALLQQGFERDGYQVRPGRGVVDFELERKGQTTLVSARRWKSAHTGLAPLRALQAARAALDMPDALVVTLGALSDSARPFAAEQRISVWQLPEIALALRGLPLSPAGTGTARPR